MAEAITVLGLIGSIINITEAILETFRLAKDAHKLPEAFAIINDLMPVAQRTLHTIDLQYQRGDDELAIRESLTRCKEKAEDLKYIFEQVCPVEGEGILQRYRRALRTLKPGRREKVESLFKGILETLQALQAFHIFRNVIPIEDLKDAIEEIVSAEPSIADSHGTSIQSSGTGAVFNNGPGNLQLKQQSGDGNYQAEQMYFSTPAVAERSALNPTLASPFYDPMLRLYRIDTTIFMPRPNALKKLESKLSLRSKRSPYRHGVLVHGMGGTGKTQLVLQYVQEHRREYSMILWMNAASGESFVHSCAQICKNLRLLEDPVREITVPQRSPAVHDLLLWLLDRPQDDHWLVILDNVDDLSWGIRDVIPKGTSGTLIATSRDSSTAQILGCYTFTLESMEPNEAKDFLRMVSFPGLEGESIELDQLCTEVGNLLDHLPLAIHLAATIILGYIESLALEEIDVNDACKAVQTYIDRFVDNKDLLLMRKDHQYMQSPYPHTLLTTFETTFAKLRGEGRPSYEPPPMNLLTLLALLEDRDARHLHDRFEQAYSAINAKPANKRFAAEYLSSWVSKILTGESSVVFAGKRTPSWDHSGYCETLGTLKRYGLVRPHADGFPQFLPLHKIVRWRVQKDAEPDELEYLEQYAVLLELALKSKTRSPSDFLRITNELADVYRKANLLTDAEELARQHLKKQVLLCGRQNASTVHSLSRLVEILAQQELSDVAEWEVFTFVRNSHDRSAVLGALPADLLLLLSSVFRREVTDRDARLPPWDPLSLDQALRNEDEDSGTIQTYIGAGQALQQTGRSLGRKRDGHHRFHDHALQRQLRDEMDDRRKALKAAADTTPDLVTLFEVLSMGSRELVSDYMRYIDTNTIQYRDPLSARSVLHFVAAYGQASDVQLCIEAGSDVDALDRYGATPLHIAGMQGRHEAFRALIQANGDQTTTDNWGCTAIEYAQQYLDRLPSVGTSARTNAVSLQRLIADYPMRASQSSPRPLLPSPRARFAIPNHASTDRYGTPDSLPPQLGASDPDGQFRSPSQRAGRYSYVESDYEDSGDESWSKLGHTSDSVEREKGNSDNLSESASWQHSDASSRPNALPGPGVERMGNADIASPHSKSPPSDPRLSRYTRRSRIDLESPEASQKTSEATGPAGGEAMRSTTTSEKSKTSTPTPLKRKSSLKTRRLESPTSIDHKTHAERPTVRFVESLEDQPNLPQPRRSTTFSSSLQAGTSQGEPTSESDTAIGKGSSRVITARDDPSLGTRNLEKHRSPRTVPMSSTDSIEKSKYPSSKRHSEISTLPARPVRQPATEAHDSLEPENVRKDATVSGSEYIVTSRRRRRRRTASSDDSRYKESERSDHDESDASGDEPARRVSAVEEPSAGPTRRRRSTKSRRRPADKTGSSQRTRSPRAPESRSVRRSFWDKLNGRPR